MISFRKPEGKEVFPALDRASLSFDSSKCVVWGNHAFVPLGKTNTSIDAEYVLTAVAKFESSFHLKVISFSYSSDLNTIDGLGFRKIDGLWVTFERVE